MKQPEHPRRSVRNIVEYVMGKACEDGCVKVANVKSAKSRSLNVRQGDAPKLVTTRTHCVY